MAEDAHDASAIGAYPLKGPLTDPTETEPGLPARGADSPFATATYPSNRHKVLKQSVLLYVWTKTRRREDPGFRKGSRSALSRTDPESREPICAIRVKHSLVALSKLGRELHFSSLIRASPRL